MPIYSIRGYDVDFPHEAYPCQLTYMEYVLGALEQSENALLESPTGTGKTLCLLCATLAWREAFMKKGKTNNPEAQESNALTLYDYKQQQAGIGAPADPAAAQLRGPAIIYSSRTHSQLAQVIKELRNTSYKVRTTVLGSRQQLCLHEQVSTMAGQAANFACRARVAQKSCRWHMKSRQDKVLQELQSAVPAPVDIEELCKVGRHAQVCPYFLSRDLAHTAEVIFMPYNYLVDQQARSQLSGISWTNAVIIIDEAHNIQDVCNNNASFDLGGEQILSAIGEMEEAQKLVKERISSGRGSEGLTVYHEGGQLLPAQGGPGGDAEFLEKLEWGVKILSALYQKLSELDTSGPSAAGSGGGGYGRGSNAFDGGGLAQKGECLLQMLADLDITPESYSQHLQQLLMDAVGVLSDHELASGRTMSGKSGVVAAGLSALITALDIVTASSLPLWHDPIRQQTGPPAHRGYRMFVHKGEASAGGKGRKQKSKGLMPVNTTTLSYWCFIPGVSMVSLRALPLRSVLLTSGTLSPLESFAHELQLGFKYTLENPHVIDPSQVWVGVVPAGPTGASLNSSYATRNSDKYKDDLGHAIVNFARVVPDGLLVFFPAYSLLQSCLDHWKASTGTAGGPTIWERILRHKAPVIEPRASSAFAAAIADYQQKLEDPNGTGAVFFAVCRGKVSEGIDFSDKAGRGVVITGLPFPAAHDPHVKLQKQLLDEEAHAGQGGIMGGRGLSGEQWYVQQGLRAVNQAMGRVIRHRWDYGAVLLADERFGYAQNQRQLSRWLREHVVQHPNFGAAIGSLTKFFKDKGDVLASAAAAAKSSRSTAGSGQQQWLSAFQLVGGSDGHAAAGSGAAAAARVEQQRRLQLANVPRAIDVLGIVNNADSQGANSQLDNILSDIQPAAAAARSALQRQQHQGSGGNAGALGRLQPAARLQRSSIAPKYETDNRSEYSGQGDLGFGAAAAAAAAAAAGGETNVVGPARLIQQHKLKQQQQQGLGDKAAVDQQQQQRDKKSSKQPLRMGQFLKQWNSTQLEQQQQQGQQQQQEESDPGISTAANNVQQALAIPAAAAAAGGSSTDVPKDPKAFFKLLQEQLPAEKMSAVKSLLTAYRTSRDLTAFVDGLIAALGSSSSSIGSSTRHLLVGFASFMPSKDQAWFRNLVEAGSAAAAESQRRQQGSQQQQQQKHGSSTVGVKRSAPAGQSAAAAAAAAGSKEQKAGSSHNIQCHRSSSDGGPHAKKPKSAASSLQKQQQQQQVGKATGISSSSKPSLGAAGGSSSSSARAPQGQPIGNQVLAGQAAASKVAGTRLPQQPADHQLAGKPLAGQRKLKVASSKLPQQQPSGHPLAGKQRAGEANPKVAGPRLPAAAAGISCKPCCICKKSPMAAAYKAGCGHMACYGCWSEQFSLNLRGVTCPVCKKVVRRQQLAQVPFA